MSLPNLSLPNRSGPDLPVSNRSADASHHPATFLERGVAVPFTTPMLLGARARSADRGGIELIVPNPSGGRGVYIRPWASICHLCRPTVYDTLLHRRIAEHHGITPASIRDAALSVAAQGLAGREAAETALAAKADETRDRLATNFLLTVAAVRQTDPGRAIDEAEVTNDHPALRLLAKYSLEQIAPRLGRTPEAVFSDLEQLAAALTPIGLDRQNPPARVPRQLAAIARFRTTAMQWARDNPDDSGAQASLAAKIAGVTGACAEITLADARASTGSLADLLKEWISTPEPVARRLARTEWLVDGWAQICAVWDNATTAATRRAALIELSLMVPILPKEVITWLSGKVDTEVTRDVPKIVLGNIDWRTGMYFSRIARNEQLHALAT
jgi:hypothetical protein